jgi:4-hydroxy-2-oxoheptanedioate aldolase
MNRVRQLLEAGRPAIGTWLSLGSVPVADVLGRGGFDWLLIDGQHSPVGPAEMFELARTVVAAGASPVIRVGGLDPYAFNQALDAGAHGVMVPTISTSEAAARAVSLATYPPGGERSIGGYWAQHSFALPRAEYLAAGAPALVVLQIESRQAVERIDEILDVAGVDVCFVGPQDLAASLGLTPRLDGTEPVYLAAIERIRTSAARRKMPLGILTGTIESARWHLEHGFQMLAVATDARLLGSAAQEISVALAEPSSKPSERTSRG